MNRARTLFLELLSAALWKRSANPQLFQHVETAIWEEVIQLAADQKVIALVYDGVRSLPAELYPEKKIMITLHLQTESIEKANDRINHALKRLSDEYDQLGCPFVLLKGQGNAIFYPDAAHRTPGDIDAYLFQKGDYQKVNDWAKNNDFEFEPECRHHMGFNIGEIHVENHHMITYFESRRHQDLLEAEMEKIIQDHSFSVIYIDNTPINLLPPTFNAFFIFQHLFHHFIHAGVGFRQLSDWVLFLHAQVDHISKDDFTDLAVKFDLLKPMQIFAYVAEKYLSTPDYIFPFERGDDSLYTDKVVQDLLDGGSFGFYRKGKKRPRGKWSGRWFSYKNTVRRTIHFQQIAPEHIRALPYNKLRNRIILLFE